MLLLLAGVGLWAFLSIASEVIEGETRAMDERILLALRQPSDRTLPIGPGWVRELGRDLTALGGVAVTVLVTLATAGYFALQRRMRPALFVLAAVAGGMLASQLMKLGFDRPRPDLVPHGSIVYGRSFPSGHSMSASITYLTLAALLARAQERRALRIYVLVWGMIPSLLVGTSRVYLGVHWPSDVLAGWTAGITWATLCWLLAQRFAIFRDGQRGT